MNKRRWKMDKLRLSAGTWVWRGGNALRPEEKCWFFCDAKGSEFRARGPILFTLDDLERAAAYVRFHGIVMPPPPRKFKHYEAGSVVRFPGEPGYGEPTNIPITVTPSPSAGGTRQEGESHG